MVYKLFIHCILSSTSLAEAILVKNLCDFDVIFLVKLLPLEMNIKS